jgi:beta-mannosidase
MTAGPWKPITLQTYDNRIAELDIRSSVSEALGVNLSAHISFAEKRRGFLSFILKGPDDAVTASKSLVPIDSGHANVSFDFKPGELKLWYPVGYGEQPLYTAIVELVDEVFYFDHSFWRGGSYQHI